MGPVDVIDDIRLDSAHPLQHQLYQRLSERILDQRYPPGRQLPPSRQMAQDLGISRNTVNAVYEQLKAEGFLQSHAGKGIFVHEDIKSAVNPSGPGLGKPGGVSMELPPLPSLPRGSRSLLKTPVCHSSRACRTLTRFQSAPGTGSCTIRKAAGHCGDMTASRGINR